MWARSQIAECSLSYAKIVQTSAMWARSQIAECSLSYAKVRKKNKNGIKKTIALFVTYHKMNIKLLLSGKQIQQIQPRLMPRGFSVELLHTDSAEDTGLELGIVIIKKEHPSLLFHQKDALSWLFFCLRVNSYLIIIFMFCEPMRTITTLWPLAQRLTEPFAAVAWSSLEPERL